MFSDQMEYLIEGQGHRKVIAWSVSPDICGFSLEKDGPKSSGLVVDPHWDLSVQSCSDHVLTVHLFSQMLVLLSVSPSM